MFKSVLSQPASEWFLLWHTCWVLFIFCLFLLLFFFFPLPLLLSFQWACLEITHNAQPHKLTDSCSGVIRCEDRITQYPISIKISRHSFSDLMLLPSHVCVINNDSTTSRRCLRYIPVLDFTPPTPPPPSPLPRCLLRHTHFGSSMRICYRFQVLQRDIYRIYSIYAVLKCQMLPYFCFCFDVH